MLFSETGRRVLGCLVEKALATPQQYPLSLNALTNACNQSTGRDPVVAWDEPTVVTGIDDLKTHQLIKVEYARGSNTPKYAHRLEDQLDLEVPQQALLAVLLLRGPQTIGELRQRTDRLHQFPSLEAVELTLTSLAEHKFGALVAALPRRPGQKEIRWTHLLAVPADAAPAPTADVPAADPTPLRGFAATDDMALPNPIEVDLPAEQAGAALPSPLAADTAELEARVETLEVRVEALESQLADALGRLDRALG